MESSKKKIFDFVLKFNKKSRTEKIYESAINRSSFNNLLIRIFMLFLFMSIIVIDLMLLKFGLELIIDSKGFIKLLGFLIILFVLFALPRPLKKNIINHKEKVNHLFELCSIISNELKVKNVDQIVITKDFNAGVYYSGLKQKLVMELGLPLISILTKEELTALILHEFAHFKNKDISSTKIYYIVCNSIYTWYELIIPSSIYEDDPNAFIGLLKIPINIALWMIGQLFYFSSIAIFIFQNKNSQISEYYADYEASRMVGVKPVVSLLNKTALDEYYYSEIAKSFNSTGTFRIDDFRTNLKKYSNGIDNLMSKKCLEVQEEYYNTHPPVNLRKKFIESKTIDTKCDFKITDEMFAKIKNELTQFNQKIEYEIIDEYRNSIYDSPA